MKCPACAAELESVYKFCPHCGQKMETSETTEEVSDEPVIVETEETTPEETAESEEKSVEATGTEETQSDSGEAPTEDEAADAEKAPEEEIDSQQQETGKKLPLKTTLLHVAAVLGILLAVVLLIIATGGKGRFTVAEGRMVMLYGEDETYFIDDNGKALSLDGLDYSLSGGMSGETSAVLDYVDGELYIYEKGSLRRVASNVRDVRTAAGGIGAAYLNDDGELYLYRGGKRTKIASGVMDDSFCISPDGKTLAYAKLSEKGRVEGYIYNGSERELGQNVVPMAIADGAKYIYYSNTDGTRLFVQKGVKSSDAQRIGGGYFAFLLNKDFSQAVVLDYEGNLSLSVKGGEPEKLVSGFVRFVFPNNTAYYYSGECAAVGVDSFEDLFVIRSSDNGMRLCYLDEERELSTVARGVEDAKLLMDGSTVYFTRDGVLYETDGTEQDGDKREICEDVRDFDVSGDGNTLYCALNDGSLRYVDSKGRSRTVSDDYDGSCSGIIYRDGKAYFVYNDAVGSYNGKSRGVVRLEGDVEYVCCFDSFIYAFAEDDGQEIYYISTDGKSFTRLG